MKKIYNNTLTRRAFSKVLRLVALLCVLMGVSSSAWAGPSWACGAVHTWHDGDKYYYLDNNCTFYGTSGEINNRDFKTVENFGVDFIALNNDKSNTYSNGQVGYQIDGGSWTTISFSRDGGSCIPSFL